jgi:nucleoside-diphosphate-sugar epimerase
MRVLITGATGVIGSRVVRFALEAGHQVTGAARSPQGRESLRRAGAAPVELDLFDVESLRRALVGHDAVINLATHIPSSSTKMMMRWAWRTNDRIRRDGSVAIAAAASTEGVRRMIQESFAPMYPDHGDEWIDESMPVAPASYNRSALDAERSANEFTERGGTGVVVRFGALYGPDALLAEMLGLMRKGWAPFPGDPRAFLSSVAQDDAARAVLAALDVPAGTYNIVDDEPMRRGDWAASLAQAAVIPTPRPLPMWMARFGSVLRLVARSQRISNRKFRSASKWFPKYRTASDAWRDVLRALPKRDEVAAA